MEWNARKHGGSKRRVWRKIHIHCPAGEWYIRREGESTRKHWKSRRQSSPLATWAMRPCCPNCSTRSCPIRRSPASPPPLTVCKQTVAGQWTGPLTLASAMMPSAPAALPRSYRPDRMPSLGSRTPPGRSHATKPSGHQNASAGRSGDDGAAITAGAASKPRCTV